MQIRSVILYNANGESRDLHFNAGRLSIITGRSKTGKSALIEIIRYCLGSDDFRVAEGAITAAVDWYAVLLEKGDTQIFVARPAPPRGQETTNQVMLNVASPIEVPTYDELEATTNINALKEYLTRLVGIEENLHVPEFGTRRPLEANISHALFYSFQRQFEIANPEQLFHRQYEDFVPQAMRDTLPYFLGAVDRDLLAKREQLRGVRLALRDAQARVEAIDNARLQEREQALILLSEAREVGLLVTVDVEPADSSEALNVALAAVPGSVAMSTSYGAEFARLERERARISGEYRSIQEQIALVNQYISEQKAFQFEAGEQVARLTSIELLPADADEAGMCPVCQQPVEDHHPDLQDLTSSLTNLRQTVSAVERESPKLQRTLLSLSQQSSDLRGQLEENRGTLDELASRQRELEALREQVNAQSFVKGRIRQYLETLQQSDDEALRAAIAEVEQLRSEAGDIEELLSADTMRENVVSILNVVGSDMREWAQQLQLEHSDSPVRIDAARLTVVADTEIGTVPLHRMGSGANWVGYHLVAHLALHKFFVDQHRPTPRFLVLDQITQAFFPPEAHPG